MNMDWNEMSTAPKDGSTIIIRSASGINTRDILFEGEANWRTENKPALYDPISKECFAEAREITGWMRADRPYKIPGIPKMWRRLPLPKNDIPKMTGKMKFNDPCFWIANNCPACGHAGRIVYTPDLLEGPIDMVCRSKDNPMRINSQCHHEWGFAATEEKKAEIRELLKLAERTNELWAEYQKNIKKLGHR